MQLPKLGPSNRLHPRVAIPVFLPILLVATFVIIVSWPSSNASEFARPQGGQRSLRQPTETLVVATTTTVAEELETEPEPPPIPVDPRTFLTPYADSVVLANTASICNTPAPENAIYVATDGDDSNPGTEAQPLATIELGVARAQEGQTVLVRGGVYRQTVRFSEKYGTADAYITLRSYPGERTKLVADVGQDAVSFRKGNAYINVACLELEGPTLRPEAIPSSPEELRNRTLAGQGQSQNPQNYGAGVDIGDRSDTRAGLPPNHHIRVIANDIHDFAEAGISAIEVNHVTAAWNRTYRNSKYGCHSGSGISFGYLIDAGGPDNLDGYSNYIIGNVSYDNENITLQCFSDNLGPILTDGNGIIIDQNNLNPAYKSRTLIADNVVFGNGGRGILVFESSRVDVINNASYHNVHTEGLLGRDGPHPEIAVADADDVKVYNNIAIPRDGHIAFTGRSSDIDERSNYFSDPSNGQDVFLAPSIDGGADFSLLDSAASLLEVGTPYLAAPDLEGNPVLLTPVNIGPVYNTNAPFPP